MTVIPPADLLAEDTLARALVTGDPRVAGLVRGADGDEAALLAAAREAATRDIDRTALVDALVAGLDDLDAPDGARAAARRLGESGVVAVVAGQQPVLLGGAGMVLTKALAAAAVAARLEAHGIPAVPVYWHASEDHDQGEADHVRLLTADCESFDSFRLALPEDGRTLAATALPPGTGDLVATATARLPDGDARERILELLAPRDGDTFGRWTGRLVAGLLGPLGIVVVEPHRLRRLAAGVTQHELTHPHELHARVSDVLRRLEASAPEITPPLDLARPELLFLLDDGVRRAITIDAAAGTYATRAGPAGDLAALRARDPSEFSWNVVARVLAQNTALPVAAQLCGPSELGYVAMFGDAHEALGLSQPATLLRPGLTAVPRKAARAARALDVDTAAAVRGAADALSPALDGPAAEAFGEALRALEALPEGRSPAVERRRAELLRRLSLFEQAYRSEYEDLDATRRRRLRCLRTSLRPRDGLAERTLSPLTWLAREGLTALPRVRDLLDRLDGGHVVAELG